MPILVALAAAGCARQQETYVINPSTGQPVPVVMQQPYAQPQYAQQSYRQQPQAAASGERGLFNSWQGAPQTYAQETTPSSGRGLFTSGQSTPSVYVQQQPATVVQYGAAQTPRYTTPRTGGPYGTAPNGFASAALY